MTKSSPEPTARAAISTSGVTTELSPTERVTLMQPAKTFGSTAEKEMAMMSSMSKKTSQETSTSTVKEETTRSSEASKALVVSSKSCSEAMETTRFGF